jgi:hypothetical protein
MRGARLATGLEVAMKLWRQGVFVNELKSMTANDGRQPVRIPGDSVTGDGYRIRLESPTTSIEAFSKKFRDVGP